MRRNLVLVLLIGVVQSSTVLADSPFRGIGRGRILRSLFGGDRKEDPEPKPKKPEKDKKDNLDPRRDPRPNPRLNNELNRYGNPQSRTSLRLEGFGILVVKQRQAVVVRNLAPRGTAAKAGLREGDILKNVGGLPVKDVSDLAHFDRMLKAGDQIEFEVRRNRDSKKILVFFKGDATPRQPTPPPVPTPAIANDYGNGDADRSADQDFENLIPADDDLKKTTYRKLQATISDQQQIINELRQRVQNLEESTDPSEELPSLNIPQ